MTSAPIPFVAYAIGIQPLTRAEAAVHLAALRIDNEMAGRDPDAGGPPFGPFVRNSLYAHAELFSTWGGLRGAEEWRAFLILLTEWAAFEARRGHPPHLLLGLDNRAEVERLKRIPGTSDLNVAIRLREPH